MNAEEPQPEKESILTHLVAGDESLQAGQQPQEPSGADTPREVRPSVEGDSAFMQILRKVLSRRSTEAVPGQGPSAAATDLPFQELGRFQIRRRLGQGTFGMVFLAFDPQLGREVALKVPRPEALLTGELRERFVREARAAAGMDHPNLVPLYEAGAVGPLCYIASAYCPGLTLDEWLKERTELPPERLAAELVARLADAVGHAHSRGVIHRDLKPSNILLQVRHPDPADADSTQKDPIGAQSLSDGDLELVPRITDFGLAKLIGDATALQDEGEGVETRTGAVLGTPNYMAPEQASGLNKEIGPAADVYALGGILYELLAGRPPFRGESLLDTLEQVRTREPLPPRRLRPKLSRDLETICLKCLQKEPHKRYETAAALAEDLRRYLGGEPIHARPIRAWERGLKWTRRHPARAALWVVGILAPLVVAGITLAYNVKLTESNDKLTNTIGQLKDANAQVNIKKGELAKSNSELEDKNRELKGAWGAEKTQRERADEQRQKAEEQRQKAEEQRKLAEERAWEARNFLYVSDMNLTQQDWLAGRVERMNDSLERHLPLPNAAGLRSDLRGFEWYYWRRLLEQKTLEGHTGLVRCVACSPDGKMLASGSQDRTVRLWDAVTGKDFPPLRGSSSPVTAVAFIEGGQTLLAARVQGVVDIFDVKTGTLQRTLRQRKPGIAHARILAAAVVPRRPVLALGLIDGNVEIWDLGKQANRRFVWQHGEGAGVEAVAFSADGRLLASGGRDGVAILWDVGTGNQLGFYHGHKKAIQGISIAPDGTRFATAGEDGTIRLWDRYAAKERAVLKGHAGTVWAVQFAPDGKTLVSAGDDTTVRIWDPVADPRTALRLVLRGHGAAVRGVAFTPDGKTIVSASADADLKLWDANPEYVLHHDNPAVTRLAFTPDGSAFATGTEDGSVKIWDTATVRLRATLPSFGKLIYGLAFAPDGKHLAVVCVDPFVHICDRQTEKEVSRLEGHKPKKGEPAGNVLAIAFSQDGTLLASGDDKGHIHIWDWKTKKTKIECADQVDHIMGLAFSPDGKLLASGGSNHVINLWDSATGRLLKTLPGHEEAIWSLAFSGDGQTLASGGEDRKVCLWNMATGKRIVSLKGHSGPVRSLAFSPDGRTLASTAKEVKLWHTETRRELATFTVPGDVLDIAWKPQGHLLAGVGQDADRLRGFIALWQGDAKAK